MEILKHWKTLAVFVKGGGGAMDLAVSAENITVAMMHTNRAGESKLLRRCSLILTGALCKKNCNQFSLSRNRRRWIYF